MLLAEKPLAHQNDKFIFGIPSESFHKQRCSRTQRILNDNPVEKPLGRIILLNPADLVNISILFGIDLRLAAIPIKLVSSFLE